jgi:multidrug efflux pump subunit AcrA (membrane-fusion protein)
MRSKWTPTPDLPDDRTLGKVIYCAPAWAFRDRHGDAHIRAEVSWPGRFNVDAMATDPVVDGATTLAPDESVCDLHVGDEQTGLAYAIPVNTFGTLVKRLKSDGDTVAAGDPLFVFDARAPTTAEWYEQSAEAFKWHREALDLRHILRSGPFAIAAWRWKQHRERRPLRRRERKEGREALKTWQAEQREQRRA